MSKRTLTVLCLVAVLAVASGCMEVKMTVSVKKDGSGTYTETMLMNAQATQMMAGMGGEQGGDMFKIEPEKCKEKAKQMGEGTKYVSAKKVTKNGWSGLETTYSFTDIRKFKLVQDPDMGMPSGPADAEVEQKPITFDFVKGGKPTLVVNLPQPDASETTEPPETTPTASMDDIPAEQMAMMQQMYKGFRFMTTIEVDGKISKTNASHVNDKKNIVTILDMNIGELMSNKEHMKVLMSMGQTKDMEVAKQKLKGIPAIKVETEKKVSIRF